jgi:tetratricopeptide (TPR) repeat protein
MKKMVWMAVLVGGVGMGVAQAQLAPPHRTVDPGSPQSVSLSSESGAALANGRSNDALALANKAITADPSNPWARYDRAAALTDLGYTDDAVAEFARAQQAFSTADSWGKSIAMYGRAHALAQAGRCPAAQAAYEEYAVFVERADPASAKMARTYARDCVPRPKS